MSSGASNREASAVVVAIVACAALIVMIGGGQRVMAEQHRDSSCTMTGAHRLTRALRVYSSCLGGGGDVSALPVGSAVVIDEYPASCPRSKAAVRFEGRWYYAGADLLRESLDGCSSSQEEARLDQAADILARACLRGELDACRALRQHEKRAAAAALESAPSVLQGQTNLDGAKTDRPGHVEPENTKNHDGLVSKATRGPDDSSDIGEGELDVAPRKTSDESTPPMPVVTKTACALRTEASLYGQLLTRLEKGRRCERVAVELPYVRVVCERDEGWAISDCFNPR